MIKNPLIVLLTDTGINDHYYACIRGIILTCCNESRIETITYNVPSFDVKTASFLLLNSYKYFPEGTIFIVIVVPEAGESIDSLIIVTRKYVFVGPNNGVLLEAANDDGILDIYMIRRNCSPYLDPLKQSFLGRDLYAYVGSMIACGHDPSEYGDEMRIEDAVVLNISDHPVICGECIDSCIEHIDKYGNIILPKEILGCFKQLAITQGDYLLLKVGSMTYISLFGYSFDSVRRGELVLYINSYGYCEIALNKGSAASILEINRDDTIRICKI